eukprot:336398-Rhodomonas_salina.1
MSANGLRTSRRSSAATELDLLQSREEVAELNELNTSKWIGSAGGLFCDEEYNARLTPDPLASEPPAAAPGAPLHP